MLDVVFGVTRARLVLPSGTVFEALQAQGLQWDRELLVVPRNVLRLRIGARGWPAAPVEVESEGERLELVKYVFRRHDGRPLSPVFRPGSALQPVALPDSTHAIGSSFGALEYLQQLDTAIDALAEPMKKISRFFYTFDLHTNPVIWDYLDLQKIPEAQWPGWKPTLVPDRNAVAGAIQRTMRRLIRRVEDRVSDHPSIPSFPKYDESTEPIAYADVRLLSALQNKLYSKAHGGLSASEIQDAFDLFANGELRLQLPGLAIAVQPSSGFYFLFGEFALNALDNGLAKGTWTNRGRTLVRTQEIFVLNYASGGVPGNLRDFQSYFSENFVNPQATPALKNALRGTYDPLGQPALATKASDNSKANLGGL